MTKVQSYIFLDIDGVLATNRNPQISKTRRFNEYTYPFNKKCVKVLNKILLLTDAEIILSSDWRRIYTWSEITMIFKFNGILKNPIDKTEHLQNRVLEINTYISANKLTNIVVIDDLDLEFTSAIFYRTKSQKGLQMLDLDPIVKILKQT